MIQILLSIYFSQILIVDSFDVYVDVKEGKLKGSSSETLFDRKLYFAFYGVPYAQTPVGKLRFKNPKPPKKWTKTYDSRAEYHGACAQAHIVHKPGLYGNEDCLRLNIYTPCLYKSGNKLKAVIVWIHGYAFTSSFSHIYGPDFFMDEDVLLVTVTHRIGALGFLKLNATDENANMGLKDIVMALKWVRRNIKQFGGNPSLVTAMGSGSGATFVSLLMNTKSNTLFAKVILQSGGIFSPSLFQGDHNLEKDRLEKLLKIKGYSNIKEATAKDIVEASQKIYSRSDVINSQRPLIPFLPIIESQTNISLLTKGPDEYFSDKQDQQLKPALIGFNSKESISEVVPFLHNPKYLTALSVHFKFLVPFSTKCKYQHTTTKYRNIADMIKHRYFKDNISEKSVKQFLQYTTDLIKYPIYNYIQSYLRLKGPQTYVYKFMYSGLFNLVKANSISGSNLKINGAASGDETCYMFRCEPISEYYAKLSHEYDNKDRIFIKKITELWANFAKTGDPTPIANLGNVTWPRITVKDEKVLKLGNVFDIIDLNKERAMVSFWDSIYGRYYEECSSHDEL